MQKGRWIKCFGEDPDGRDFELLPATEDQYSHVEIVGTIADGGEHAEGATLDMVMGVIHVNFRRKSTPKERKIRSSYDEYRELLETSLGASSSVVPRPSEARRNSPGISSEAAATPSRRAILRLSSILAHFRLQPFEGEHAWGMRRIPTDSQTNSSTPRTQTSTVKDSAALTSSTPNSSGAGPSS